MGINSLFFSVKKNQNNNDQEIVPQIATIAMKNIAIPANLDKFNKQKSSDFNNQIIPHVLGVKSNKLKKTISNPDVINPQYKYYFVSSIVDGDTLKLNINGTIETFRLIGIDTPETVDPRKPVQCFGKEASKEAKKLLAGKKVRIEKDPLTGEFDRYGRRLAYIFREDGLFYNKYMIEQGYAHEYTYNSIPYKYQGEFKIAQKSAQKNLRGLWSPNTCNNNTILNDSKSVLYRTATLNSFKGKYYTSSYYSSLYYYPEFCNNWKNLNKKYLKRYDSLESLLKVYPAKILSPQCQ
ncbi:MAG: hypothetical protein GWO87_01950 [Xanthomonadaceae bacterium]|nr:hypothetical protein [Rhodospirillaceae bacterium]NIA17933.1 hypothetical protein [Xanthomonadaceae bacterium]